MTTMTTTNVIDLLHRQHDEVRGLFDDVLKSTGDSRRESFQCLVRLLAVHETAEEEVVHPAVRNLPGGAAAVDPRLEEESEAKVAVAELERIGPDDDSFPTKLRELHDDVEQHAALEEQLVFPRLMETKDKSRLERMGRSLEIAEKLAPTHAHPHAPESRGGNLLVGPFVAIADRARDAISSLK